MKKSGNIFLIDCDEVLRQTLKNMLAIYNDAFPNNKKELNQITTFVVEEAFPDIEPLTGITASNWFFQNHSTELFANSEPYPFIKEDINTLKKYGKVVILTYQKSYLNKVQTLEWLEKNEIEPDGICFLKDKTLIHADYLIDDNDWNFIGSNATHGILVTAPYNVGKEIEDIRGTSYCKTMTRVNSLHEFVGNFVEEYNEKFKEI